jgi:hypothetical protein
MRIQRAGKTERHDAIASTTIDEGMRDHNQESTVSQIKRSEKGFGIVEALLVFAICDGAFALTSAVYGILGAIFDWFD